MKKTIKFSTFLVIIANLLNKGTGFIREMLVASNLGATSEADNYILSITIPTLLFNGIIVALGNALTPIYYDIKSNKSEKEANKYLSNLFYIVIILSLFILILSYFNMELLVDVIASGLVDNEKQKIISYSKILIFTILSIGISQMIINILQVYKKFFISTVSTVIINIILILVLSLYEYIGIKGIIYGTVLAYFIQMLIYVPLLKVTTFKFYFCFNLKDPLIKRTLVIMLPIFVSITVQQFSLMIDRSIASNFESGSVALLNYANSIVGVIFGIISISIATVIFPNLSQAAKSKNDKEAKNIIIDAIDNTFLLVIPLVAFTIIFSDQIVNVFFARGSFTNSMAINTSNVLKYYAVGMIFFSLRDILNKIYYSYEETKFPMYNSSICILINIVMSLIFAKKMGVNGIALGTSIGAMLSTLSLIYNLRNKIGINKILIWKKIVFYIITAFLGCWGIRKLYSSLLMIALDNFVINLMYLGLSSISFIIIYILIVWILKKSLHQKWYLTK